MNTLTRVTAFAAGLLLAGGILGATPAGAAPAPETIGTAGADSCGPQYNHWVIPDGEGAHAGWLTFWDWNAGADRDNFLISDRPLDGQSSSLWVRNNYTGKTYYKHVYSGEEYCMDIGTLPDGYSVDFKACGWDDGEVMECIRDDVVE